MESNEALGWSIPACRGVIFCSDWLTYCLQIQCLFISNGYVGSWMRFAVEKIEVSWIWMSVPDFHKEVSEFNTNFISLAVFNENVITSILGFLSLTERKDCMILRIPISVTTGVILASLFIWRPLWKSTSHALQKFTGDVSCLTK